MMTKQVLIRTDASSLIGTGHVMRCLTLAERLKADGCGIVFVTRELPNNLSHLIEQKGFQCELLPFSELEKSHYSQIAPTDDYNQWLGVDQQREISESKAIVQQYNPDLIVVDHYALDKQWHQAMRPLTDKIMVIDDLANREHDCDIILDHNFYVDYSTRYNDLVPAHCHKLLGPKHALINPKLKDVKQKRQELGKDHHQPINDVLVFMGGYDPANYTDYVLRHMIGSKCINQATFHVVLGKNNPNKTQLKQAYAQFDNIIFYVQPDHYYDLLAKADLAIGGGGVSQLERSYINLSSLMVCLADNQTKIIHDNAQSQGSAVFDVTDIRQSLDNLHTSEFNVEAELLEINKILSLFKHDITIVTPYESWFVTFARKLQYQLEQDGFDVFFTNSHKQVPVSQIVFYLSYSNLVPQNVLNQATSNIVVHASDLPKGKGWSPWVWEMVEGHNELTLTLFELTQELDAGPYYAKEKLQFEGHELLDEIRYNLAHKIIHMCSQYAHGQYGFQPIKQSGESSYYRKRTPQDNEIDIQATIYSNFNLFRLADNEAYPVFFQYQGYVYTLKIQKEA